MSVPSATRSISYLNWPSLASRREFLLALGFAPRSLRPASSPALSGEPTPAPVEIRKEGAGFRLYRGGIPYFIKGVVYGGDMGGRFPLAGVAACGANSIRTGGGPALLDQAHALGLSVLANLPMRMEKVHNFDYSDEKAVGEQREKIQQRILALKDHPALLMWAIGNELTVFNATNKRVWKAVNDIARFIHQVDPYHPCMTVIGDGSLNRGELEEIQEMAPELDLVGINYYAGIETVPAKVRQQGWKKPYVITEWGPSGDWQVPRTQWGASIEETSTEKAQRYLQRYQNAILKDQELCLGSYAFIWGWRHERTQTWYGMHLATGERLQAVEVLQYLWTGSWPENRAPRIQDLLLEGRRPAENVHLKPGALAHAAVHCTDPENDVLSFKWEILAEVARAGYAGMGETPSSPIPELIVKAEENRLLFRAPSTPGAYRVFVFVFDGKGNAATANFPFYVQT